MEEKKSWKLFGKLNIIDLIIIVVVIAAIVVLAVRALGGGKKDAGEQLVRVTFYSNWVPNYVPDSVAIGDPATQYSTDLDLGTLVDFSYEPAYSYVYDETHQEIVKIYNDDYVLMTFTTECAGLWGKDGLTIGDTTFVVGSNHYVNIGYTRAGYQIQSFEPLGKVPEGWKSATELLKEAGK